MSDTLTTGKCLCGAVSYTITGSPVRAAQCHCKDCQRASGCGHMSLAFFKADQVALSGDTKSFAVTADSGNINTRHFCPDCGSRIYSENSARAGVVGIAVGSCDDSAWFAPEFVVYEKDRAGWDITTDDIPHHDGMPT